MTYNKHQSYMDAAHAMARQSKCVRLQVGCVIVNEYGRLMTSGVNGSGMGQVNCNEVDHGPDNCNHHDWSKMHELHAEKNALFNVMHSGARCNEMTFYVTHSPCQQCLTDIVVMASNFGIKVPAIVYDVKYDRLSNSELDKQKEFCRNHGTLLLSLSTLKTA